MTPNSSLSSSNLNGRLDLAVDAIQSKKIASIREAARIYGVPRSILGSRLKGVQAFDTLRANGFKLIVHEEDLLKQWIISIDIRRVSSRPL